MDYAALHTALSNAQRLALIGAIPLAQVVSAPGHRALRRPEAVLEIAQAMREGRWANPASEPILIGIFTREDGGQVGLRAVECLDGHHRLLAGLLAGVWQLLGDLPDGSIDTRVNGWRADGTEAEPRWIPLDVARRSRLPASDWSEVPPSWGAKGPTAMIPGSVSGVDDVFDAEDRSIALGALAKIAAAAASDDRRSSD
jgi:hypothetical protein